MIANRWIGWAAAAALALGASETAQAAIRRDGLRTVAQVGRRTRATTGCGSCAADVQALLAHAAASDS